MKNIATTPAIKTARPPTAPPAIAPAGTEWETGCEPPTTVPLLFPSPEGMIDGEVVVGSVLPELNGAMPLDELADFEVTEEEVAMDSSLTVVAPLLVLTPPLLAPMEVGDGPPSGEEDCCPWVVTGPLDGELAVPKLSKTNINFQITIFDKRQLTPSCIERSQVATMNG